MGVAGEKKGTIIVGTRASTLAMVQTEMAIAGLAAAHPDLSCHIKQIRTGGDRDQRTPLTTMGGQGIFVKEIENALLAGEIDIAVHSLKDLPTTVPEGLTIGAILRREDARDALISGLGLRLAELPPHARVGTGSLRRQAQLRALRPDIEVVGLRGNVNTRLDKAATLEYDAVVLAVAGLIRLGRSNEITEVIPPEIILPAVGQGAICVEVRSDDHDTLALMKELDNPITRACVTGERSFLRELGGGCQVPIAAHAVMGDGELWLRGLVADPSGSRVVQGEVRGSSALACELGRALALRLVNQGARELLEEENIA